MEKSQTDHVEHRSGKDRRRTFLNGMDRRQSAGQGHDRRLIETAAVDQLNAVQIVTEGYWGEYEDSLSAE